MDPLLAVISHPIAMATYGLAAHFLFSLKEASKAQETAVTPTAYLGRHPYRSGLAVFGAVAGVGALADAGQLTAIAGFSAGWLADSVPEKISRGTFGGKG